MKEYKIKLITETIGTNADGFETHTQTSTKEIFAEQLSMSRYEFYNAAAAGIKADRVIKIRAWEYNDQTELEIDNKRYKVVRVYERNDEWLELTIARK